MFLKMFESAAFLPNKIDRVKLYFTGVVLFPRIHNCYLRLILQHSKDLFRLSFINDSFGRICLAFQTAVQPKAQ